MHAIRDIYSNIKPPKQILKKDPWSQAVIKA